jgi:hypothetical protein
VTKRTTAAGKKYKNIIHHNDCEKAHKRGRDVSASQQPFKKKTGEQL